MKYVALVAAFCYMVTCNSGCKEGMAIYFFPDSSCNPKKMLKTATRKLTAAEAETDACV